MRTFINKFVQDDSGATAVEYGLIAALVSVAAVTALASVGGSLDALFNEVSTGVENAATS